MGAALKLGGVGSGVGWGCLAPVTLASSLRAVPVFSTCFCSASVYPGSAVWKRVSTLKRDRERDRADHEARDEAEARALDAEPPRHCLPAVGDQQHRRRGAERVGERQGDRADGDVVRGGDRGDRREHRSRARGRRRARATRRAGSRRRRPGSGSAARTAARPPGRTAARAASPRRRRGARSRCCAAGRRAARAC